MQNSGKTYAGKITTGIVSQDMQRMGLREKSREWIIFEIDDEMLSMEFHQLMPEDINEDYKKLKRSIECVYASPESVEAEFIRLATGAGTLKTS